jgi:hypothetical protein
MQSGRVERTEAFSSPQKAIIFVEAEGRVVEAKGSERDDVVLSDALVIGPGQGESGRREGY